MAEEKQLTVAELLARNAEKRDGEGEPRRRRRRRSLEEGGISVAELTGSLTKVDVVPEQPKHSSVDIDEPAPVIPAPKEDAAAKAVEEKRAVEAAEIEEKKRAEFQRKVAEAKKEAEARRKEKEAEKPAPTLSEEDTTVMAKVEDEPEAPEEESINPVSIVILALIGIVLGAVAFKGFEILWGTLSRPLVAVLALAVTGIMAGVVHALRTDRDRLAIGMAIVVGLVLTFGPLLIV